MSDVSGVEEKKGVRLSLEDFDRLLVSRSAPSLSPAQQARMEEVRAFIEYLLEKKIRVYGLTTGFADLRNFSVDADKAALLSRNMILSHDAGIGPPLPSSVTYGAMYLRAHSLAQGYSGFSLESMTTLLKMIEAEIIPEIPSTGSLGASGDLAFLARLGRAMMGEEVPVTFGGERMSATQALARARIAPMIPKAKEGLALTNGTPFMASMVAQSYSRILRFYDRLFPLLGLFLSAVDAVDDAFCTSIQTVRNQRGQEHVAALLRPYLSVVESSEVQNDYCIRCLPQILGPKLEVVWEQREKIERELNAVTDNPLIFRGEEISPDIRTSQRIHFQGLDWAVVSGGNFHGETSATVADILAITNAKVALTLERQITYLFNPARNGHKLPVYLIPDRRSAGYQSGFMITQYTANALAHKISLLAHPASAMNITSANEAEDVVSYGATAAHKLYDQAGLLEELLAIYLLASTQAYAIARQNQRQRNRACEDLYEFFAQHLQLPQMEDQSFDHKYRVALSLIQSGRF
jgi:histidine ammonia-lyase